MGRNAPNFSARYSRIAPDSNTRIGVGPLRSISAGILEFGFTAHEAAAELIAFADLDEPRVVLRPVPSAQQLFQHHRDLHAVRRGERVELQRMTADRQLLLVRRPGDRPIDVGERPPFGLFQVQTFGGVYSGGSLM